MNIINTNTRCVARFFPFKNRETLDGNDTNSAMEATELFEDDAIFSCSVTREKSAPYGSFNLNLKPIKNYYNLIRPGDWVIIYLDDSKNIDIKDLKGVKCVGTVSRMAYNKVTNNDGSIVTTFSISGCDFGRIFEVSEFFYNPYAPEEFIRAFVQDLDLKLQGSPMDYVNGMLDIYLGNAQNQNLREMLFQMLIPSKVYEALKGGDSSKGFAVSFNDIVKRKFNKNAEEGFCLFKDVNKMNAASLWSVLQQSANTIVNEIYTDIEDGQPTLVFQKQPLTKDQILEAARDATELSEAYIINYNLGLSDFEIFNYMSIWPSDQMINSFAYLASAELAGKIPSIAQDSIKRFGFRMIDRQTDYAYQEGAYLFSQLGAWIDEVKEFWFNCYHFESGTIEVIGRNNFNIGRFIKIPERDVIYRIEGITWDWAYGDHLVTSLTVTYGMKSDGTYLDQDDSEGMPYGTTVYERKNDKKYGV